MWILRRYYCWLVRNLVQTNWPITFESLLVRLLWVAAVISSPQIIIVLSIMLNAKDKGKQSYELANDDSDEQKRNRRDEGEQNVRQKRVAMHRHIIRLEQKKTKSGWELLLAAAGASGGAKKARKMLIVWFTARHPRRLHDFVPSPLRVTAKSQDKPKNRNQMWSDSARVNKLKSVEGKKNKLARW